MEKYFATFVIRKDGASEFGANHKWATFPAISGSWRLSQEGFMRTGPFSELRLRAGWGKQGNPAVPPYSSRLDSVRLLWATRISSGKRRHRPTSHSTTV